MMKLFLQGNSRRRGASGGRLPIIKAQNNEKPRTRARKKEGNSPTGRDFFRNFAATRDFPHHTGTFPTLP
ncbi:MAG: hypothetical protein PUD40_04575 [Bacteroidales bacterium]|nr:hypothetical protein [Bacteroidales bacterium]